MEDSNSYILAIIALLGVVAGPVISYLAIKRKSGSEALLIDTQTIKSWSETRTTQENEIQDLYTRLDKEREKRIIAQLEASALKTKVSELETILLQEKEERRMAEESYREALKEMRGEIESLKKELEKKSNR